MIFFVVLSRAKTIRLTAPQLNITVKSLMGTSDRDVAEEDKEDDNPSKRAARDKNDFTTEQEQHS